MTDRLTRPTVIRSLTALLGMLLIVAMASAQTPRGEGMRVPGGWPGMGGTGGAPMQRLLQPDYHARDMAILSRQLELDHSQRPIFEMLLEDYREAFRDAAYELDRALRHMQLQRIEERLEQRIDRTNSRGPENAISIPVERITFDGADASELSRNVQVDMSAGSMTVRHTEFEGSAVVMITTDDPPSDMAQRREISSDAIGPYVRLRRGGTDDTDDTVDEIREIPVEVQERIERMRERIRRRMEERLEQQREEMRQRGIDPDEEVEPLEPEEIAELAKSLLTEKERLRNRFEADAHLLLTPRQRESLPETFRIIRRLNALPDSRLSGEQVDLVRVLDEERLLSLNDSDLEFAINEYTAALDDALTRRVRYLERAEIDQFLARQHDDSDMLLTLTDKEIERRVAVRSVNETFTEFIAELLHESDRDRFESAVIARAFPEVARSTPLERILPIVREHDSLTDEQRQYVEHLQTQHAVAAESHRRETIQMMREREVKQPREIMEFSQRLREIRASGEDMRQIDWSELQPPVPVQFATRFVHHQLDRPFFEQLQGIVPADRLEEMADQNEAARSALDAMNRYRNLRQSGERRWGRRGERGRE